MLSKADTVAGPTYTRWLAPPAVFLVHMAVGQLNALSVLLPSLATGLEVSQATVGWAYAVASLFLGIAPALVGSWVDWQGPRKAIVVAAGLFCAGLILAGIAVSRGSTIGFVAAYGLVAGFGIGMGYLAPVATLVRWFPDRPGLASGFSIMGYGAGGLVGAPLARMIVDACGRTPDGLQRVFLILAAVYGVAMLVGAWLLRIPPRGWTPFGFVPPRSTTVVTEIPVAPDVALKTPQFRGLVIVLLCSAIGGAGFLGHAAGIFTAMTRSPAEAAAAFVAMLGLANMLGRVVWPIVSDDRGRKRTFSLMFLVMALAFCAVPWAAAERSTGGFIVASMVAVACFGGGSAMMPAYVRDLFGTMGVGAIYGRVLPARAAAGFFGPVFIVSASGALATIPAVASHAWSIVFLVLAAIALVGGLVNRTISRVDGAKAHLGEMLTMTPFAVKGVAVAAGSGVSPATVVAWSVVGLPVLWAIADSLFRIIQYVG